MYWRDTRRSAVYDRDFQADSKGLPMKYVCCVGIMLEQENLKWIERCYIHFLEQISPITKALSLSD